MKKLTYFFCSLSLFVSAPFAFSNHHLAGEAEEEHTALENEMSAMDKAWRTVRRSVKDPRKLAEASGLVATMIEHAEKSVDMDPILLAEQKGAAKKEFKEGYQRDMRATVMMLKELKATLDARDQSAADALVAKINKARSDGHKAYKPDDD